MPCTCSNVFPLVSGTNSKQKINVRAVIPPNSQKQNASEIAPTRSEKNFVTQKARVQLIEVANDEARPFIFGENSSDIINHGIGPNPTLKAKMNTHREMTGRISRLVASSVLFWLILMKKKAPREDIERTIIDEEKVSRNLLPSLSITAAPKPVDTTCMIPIMIDSILGLIELPAALKMSTT